MLEAFSEDAKGQRLNLSDGFIAVLAVAQDAGQSRHAGQPAAVVFTFQLDRESHAGTVLFAPAV